MDDTQSMTVRLPVGLHERLRREAFDKRVSMNSLLLAALGRPDLARLDPALKPARLWAIALLENHGAVPTRDAVDDVLARLAALDAELRRFAEQFPDEAASMYRRPVSPQPVQPWQWTLSAEQLEAGSRPLPEGKDQTGTAAEDRGQQG